MGEVYRAIIPDCVTRRAELLRERSVVHWADSIAVPLLILDGGDDWRVLPGDAIAAAESLERARRRYELVIYGGDDHSLTHSWTDAVDRMRRWFDRH